jgi:hypothetical protein
MEESDLQDEKHDDSRISTFRGISIDPSDESENADDPIRFNREFDSNEMNRIGLHPLKQFADNTGIDPGIHARGSSNLSGVRMNMVSITPQLTIFRQIESNLT